METNFHQENCSENRCLCCHEPTPPKQEGLIEPPPVATLMEQVMRIDTELPVEGLQDIKLVLIRLVNALGLGDAK